MDTEANSEANPCLWLDDVGMDDVDLVGGKNASLGEMITNLAGMGIGVPGGFATTAAAYRRFLTSNELEERIAERLAGLDDGDALEEVGADVRSLLLEAEVPDELRTAIVDHYRELGRRLDQADMDVAVRSSATAEDLPDASFAGQQETYLNISGEDEVVDACRRCFASLFTDRAIAYRAERGFDHLDVALSVGVQQMVRADRASAGVMFSVDTETGFPDVVVINAAFGLGEAVVDGSVDPDEYVVFKPLLEQPELRPIVSKRCGAKTSRVVYDDKGSTSVEQTDDELRRSFALTDDEIIELARHACAIERHYGRPMDIEWAKDDPSGELLVVQARPETVQSGAAAEGLASYELDDHGETPLLVGQAIGAAVAAGPAQVLESVADGADFPDGGVLVTAMTDPDWVPIMRRAAAIVTDHGGRTSHAAIVSRELGVPAVIGTAEATTSLSSGSLLTVSCAHGDEGRVYEGELSWEREVLDLDDVPETSTRVMLNLADPGAALRWWRLPADGVGLARMELIVGNHLGVHPMALVHPDQVEDGEAQQRIEELAAAYPDPVTWFVEELAQGIARIAVAHHPRPVVVRTSDFKTNEYAELLGGAGFEPPEENPMLGWRGASRYHHPGYRDGFALECRALRLVRDRLGLTNVVVMIPFCRTVEEADEVLTVLADEGLVRGRNGLAVQVMAEIPANVILADRFAERFDGFSIGSNDLTQLLLGVDRDSSLLSDLFDESDPAVREAISSLVESAHANGATVGLCGQGPSDDPEIARFLVSCGIDSVSVTPDSFMAVKRTVAEAEAAAQRGAGRQRGAGGQRGAGQPV